MPSPKKKRCKDCVAELKAIDPDAPLPPVWQMRKADKPGPRCASHWRKEVARQKEAAHDAYVCKTYGLKPGQYAALYAAQGGGCAMPMCNSAGKSKRLAVDHDHRCCPGSTSCGKCVRGLLCQPCNDVLAVARDSTFYFIDCVLYLISPPARKVLAQWQ